MSYLSYIYNKLLSNYIDNKSIACYTICKKVDKGIERETFKEERVH